MKSKLMYREHCTVIRTTRCGDLWRRAGLVLCLLALLAWGAHIDNPPPEAEAMQGSDFSTALDQARDEMAPAVLEAWRAGVAAGQAQCTQRRPL